MQLPPPGEKGNAPDRQAADEPRDLKSDFDAGVAFGQDIKRRFVRPRVDDPGLPFADALVVICGSLFVAGLGLTGTLPRQSWLEPLPGTAVDGLRGLPYILPAFTHGSALAACWTLGALAASAYESEAYIGSMREALARTWRGGAFAIGTLILCTQLATSVALAQQGLDPLLPSAEADYRLLSTAFEVITDVVVQAVGLTAFRLYRWQDAQRYK